MRLRDRPAATYRTGAATRALRAAAALTCAAGVVGALVYYPSLPDSVPTHLDASGTPDAWGPRWSALVWVGLWAVIQVLLTWLSRHPRLFNYPLPLTESNAQGLYREGERMMVWVCLGVSAVFSGLVLSTYGIEAGIVLVVVGLIGLLGSTVAGMIRIALADVR